MSNEIRPGEARHRTRTFVAAESSGRLYRFRMLVVTALDRTQASAELVAIVLTVIFLGLMYLNMLATTQVTAIGTPQVSVREIGDPERARERIVAENFTTLDHLDALAEDSSLNEMHRMVYAHTPLILRYGTEFPERQNTPIGLYYVATESTSGDATATTIRYYLWFTDEASGMPIEQRLAMFGHSMDRELVYRVTLLGDRVVGAYYQAPGHRLVSMNYMGEARPVFAVASANNNFRQVTTRELDSPAENFMLVPLAHPESPWAPAHDPDFAALAASEVWEKYHIDLSTFVFVEFDIPLERTVVTTSIRINERWYYLHEQIGGGVSRPGYNQVGVEIGYPIFPEDVQEVRLVTYSPEAIDPQSVRVMIYPRSDVAA
jgi:hypothetical protein